MTFQHIGFLYHPSVAAAERLAAVLQSAVLPRVRDVWSFSAWDGRAEARLADTDMLVCVGGDGTMLRGARAVIPHPIPIFGVNMGRLGFLSESAPDLALRHLLDVLDGAGRIEQRMMLQAAVQLPEDGPTAEVGIQHVLNDVAVGRHGGRPVYLRVIIDGVQVETMRADGVVVSTATGSTGYNLSAGGPVLCPESPDMVLTPIAAHLAHVRPIVLPPQTRIELQVETDLQALISYDGQVDYPLPSGSRVRITRSPHLARFIRLGPPADFFRNLTLLLNGGHGESGAPDPSSAREE